MVYGQYYVYFWSFLLLNYTCLILISKAGQHVTVRTNTDCLCWCNKIIGCQAGSMIKYEAYSCC